MEKEKLERAIRSSSDVGPTIRLIRKSLNLTQQQLAKMTGIKQQTISGIESGAQQANLKTLFAILSTLNLELVVHKRAQRIRGYAPGRKD